MKRAHLYPLVCVVFVGSVVAGCTKGDSAGSTTTVSPSVLGPVPATTQAPTTTAATTTTSTVPPSSFAEMLAAADQPVYRAWSDERPVASPVTVGENWVAVAVYAGGTRRDLVLDRRTGAEMWSRRSTSSVAAPEAARVAPLVIDNVLIHLEADGAQSEGALLQGIDVTSGETLWVSERPAWFPTAPFECGPQRVCAITWENYERGRKIVEYDVLTGRLIAQGSAGSTGVVADVGVVDPTAADGEGDDDYPRPPATIPDLAGAKNPVPPTTPPPTTPPPTTPPPTTQPPTTPPPTTPVTAAPAGARRGTPVDFEPIGLSVSGRPETAPAPSEPMLVRFGGAGNHRWEVPLNGLFGGIEPGQVPSASLDREAGVLIVGSPPGSIRPDQDTVYGLDYESGQVLWEAPNRSLNCWQWLIRPANVRCEITGAIQTGTDADGDEAITGYRNIQVEFEAFAPRTGQTMGSVKASYPDWDGEADRPVVPSKTWYVADGLIIESNSGVIGLSTIDGEQLPLLVAVTAWCEQGPVDDDGEIYPGFYPCESGDPTRTPVDGELTAMPDFVGAIGDDGAVFVQDGRVVAVGFGAAPPPEPTSNPESNTSDAPTPEPSATSSP